MCTYIYIYTHIYCVYMTTRNPYQFLSRCRDMAAWSSSTTLTAPMVRSSLTVRLRLALSNEKRRCMVSASELPKSTHLIYIYI